MHQCHQRVHIAIAAIVRHIVALSGAHLHKTLPRKLGDAGIDHGAAHVHLLTQLPLRRQFCPHRQLTRQDHILQLLDKQIFQTGGI